MEAKILSQKAKELHKAATSPSLQNTLYADSIKAIWNPMTQSFTALTIDGMRENRYTPTNSVKFTLRFLAGDPTDDEAVEKRVRDKMRGLAKVEARL